MLAENSKLGLDYTDGGLWKSAALSGYRGDCAALRNGDLYLLY